VSTPQRFVVHIADRSHEVEVFDDGRVLVDGVASTWIRSGDGRTLIREESGRQESIVLAPGARPKEGAVGGRRVELQVQTAAEAALDAALGTGAAGGGDGRLTAPMPGRIVKVSVAVGDEVEAGSPVVIIEAMKMENELQAPSSGTVVSVEVEAGQAVEAGVVLLTIEAPQDDQD
jgi:biotin carboxyl carrier protein